MISWQAYPALGMRADYTAVTQAMTCPSGQFEWPPHPQRELDLAVHETAHETSLALMQGRLQAKRIFDAELTRLRHRLGVDGLNEDLPF